MKKFTLFFVMSLCVALFAINRSQAQDAEAPRFYLVMEEFVAPADLSEFWKVQSEGIALWDSLEIQMTYSAYHTDQNSFYWAVPIQNFAALDDFYATWVVNSNAMKEAGWDPELKFRDLSNISQFVVMWDKELSYKPVKEEAAAEPDIFYEWSFIYLKSGHEKEAAETVQKYIDFTKEEGIDYRWDIYRVVFGNHTPCWILETRAESEEAMRHFESENNKKYKEEYRELWRNFVQHVRTIETTKGWYLPKWSRNVGE